jgi:2-polyprenyl-3-methyl-5-hydroxy-6-metoxy-1,4-benzoquinol methylase
MMNESQERLRALYMEKSKHSNYQVLSGRLRSILGENEIVTNTRSERERLDYLLSKVDVQDKTVIDIGGNTGFFSFELLEAGARSVHVVEGNKDHAEFVRVAAEAIGVGERVVVTPEYFQFDGRTEGHYDVGLLFNVLHHVGDDYGSLESLEDTKRLILEQLNSMSRIVDTLVFQLGFNWMGDPSKPLFKDGTKQEQIDFITAGVEGYWKIEHVGVAAGTREQAHYADVDETNIDRDDALGEFLNRPIFILKSVNGEVEVA